MLEKGAFCAIVYVSPITARLTLNQFNIMKRTIFTEFKAGADSGLYPCLENDAKAEAALICHFTEPLVLAYWAGYLSQRGVDNK